jgi:hypothetical protein
VRYRYIILFVIIAVIVGFVIQRRSSQSSPFDKPLKITEVDLGVNPYSPSTRGRVTCLYFAGFMVKEIDTGEKGAEQISIVPAETQCQRNNVPAEVVIDGWSGYLYGVKSPYLFLRGDDGFGLRFDFGVFDIRIGKQLFEDSILTTAPFDSIEVNGSNLTMRYRRVAQLKCSLYPGPKNEGWQECWENTRRELSLDMPVPNCAEAYLRDAPSDDPSQIAYDSRGEWDGNQFTVTPVGSSALCAPTP